MVSALEIVIGFSAGAIAGSAIAAFYSALGLYSKIGRSVTRAQRDAFAFASALGATVGAWCYFLSPYIGGGEFAEAVFGIFTGVFTGIYIALIAEVLEYIPFLRRLGVRRGCVCVVLIAFAAGKFIGQLFYGFEMGG